MNHSLGLKMAPFSACFLPLSWMLVCMGFFFCYTVKVYLPKTLVKIGCCHRYCIARKAFAEAEILSFQNIILTAEGFCYVYGETKR